MVRPRLTSFGSTSLSRRIAATWFARNRSAGGESPAFRDWVEAEPQHERDYDQIDEVWRALEVLEEDVESRQAAARAVSGLWSRPWRLAAAIAAGVVLCVIAGSSWWLAPFDQHYRTGVGDQRVVSLADGSLLTLNTDSRVDVQIDGRSRRVRLDRGEAFFDIAHLPNGPPFEVVGGGTRIRVVGTRFNVRLTDQGVDLDVIEGRVETRRDDGVAAGAARPVVVTAGQRADFDPAGVVRTRGATDAERVTSWRLGRVRMDDMPLQEAVQEMNRYSERKLVIGSPGIGDLRVSGVFRVGSVDSFANALKLSRGLDIVVKGEKIIITDYHQPSDVVSHEDM